MTALDGASLRARTPALDGDPGLAAMFGHPPAEWTARISDGTRCVGALALDTQRQQAPLLAGLSHRHGLPLAVRVEALRVWAEVAGDVALDEEDDQHQANRLALAGVLAGLLPGLDCEHGGPLEMAEEELTAAGLRAADLALHKARGTHPEYLPGDVSVQDAMAADETDAAFALRELAAQWAARWDGGPS